MCGEENGTPLDTGKSERRVKASQSSWIEMLGREERAYKVRFQVGALIQDLYRLLRRNNGSWCSTIFFGGGGLDKIIKRVKNAERGDD